MDSFIILPAKERALLLNEAAKRHGKMNAQILEKDFWVCWALKMLFEIPELSPHLTFKGGTSLSKVYGLIDRFSEDVDLTIDKEYLGLSSSNWSANDTSRKIRQEYRKTLDKACSQTLADQVMPLLNKYFASALNSHDWTISIAENDSLTILFQYPPSIVYGASDTAQEDFVYIKPVIRLEFGARGENFPSEIHAISPYVVDLLPEIFDNTTATKVSVRSLGAERTFWEKVTILHDLYHKDKDKTLKQNIARHYYDTVMLVRKGVANQAVPRRDLLEAVVRNSRLNCTDSNESESYKAYDELLERNIRLVPTAWRIPELQRDYIKMQESGMFFGDFPSFEKILRELEELEGVVNMGK